MQEWIDLPRRVLDEKNQSNLIQNLFNHSFKNIKKRNATELSKTFWNAKESGLNPTINRKIINQVTPYKPGQKCCNLCLTEKLKILQAKQPTILNKRSELTGKCRHKNKFKLNKLPT